MQSIEYNLALLEIMLEEFEAYILSTVIFWPLSSKGKSTRLSSLPRLSLGGLCLTLDELVSQENKMNRDQENQYLRQVRTFERFVTKWQVSIERKAQQELNSRVNLWQAYMKDLDDDPELIEEYFREVRIRVMISHLIDLSGSKHQIEEKLHILDSIDQQIDRFLSEDTFIWDEPLEKVYPREKFPFLYRSSH